MKSYDAVVIGGGINGAGIARDLAGRGLSVMLVEKDDLASATSSASTKLVHGGLRYLEHFEFRLVREALQEREVLLRAAPHIIWPLTFVLPHHRGLRPRWMIRAGLFLYDFLAPRKSLKRSRGHFLPGTALGAPLKSEYKRGFTYADCWVEDSRLVVLNALDAAEKGATIMTRTECTGLGKHPKEDGWIVQLHDHLRDVPLKIKTGMVVNAAGPWVSNVVGMINSDAVTQYHTRLVKGSHIIVPRLYKGDHAYVLQNSDKRIVFVIPYEKKYSLIGTTDIDYEGDPAEVRISDDEVDYLCKVVKDYFRKEVKPEQVEWAYSGVRPLFDDGEGDASSVTRDYKLEQTDHKGAPLINVYGGKLTTFRKLSEQVGTMVTQTLKKGKGAWTSHVPLPGGEGPAATFETFYKTFKREFNWLPEEMCMRYARSYGTRAREILRGFKRMSDLGIHLGDDVYEVEIAYLVKVEWAMTAEDILWRRSKLGLHVSDSTRKEIERLLRVYMSKGAA